MKAVLFKFDSLFRKLESVLAIISGIFVVIMMFLITIDVILRYVFNSPLPGTIELVQFLFIGVVFLAVSYVQAIKGHIMIEIGTNRLSNESKKFLELFGFVIAICIVAIITCQSGVETWSSIETKDYSMGIIQFPLWPPKLALTFGMLLLLIRLVLDFFIKLISPYEAESYGIHH